MKRYSEYTRGKADGMAFALSLVKEGGVELLEKEIRLRGVTGISPAGKFSDLDAQIDSITAWSLRQVFVVAVAAIHDAYGIGPKRMEAFFEKFTEGTRLLMKGKHGGAFWTDYSREIRETYGVELHANPHGVLVERKGQPGKAQAQSGNVPSQSTGRRRAGKDDKPIKSSPDGKGGLKAPRKRRDDGIEKKDDGRS